MCWPLPPYCFGSELSLISLKGYPTQMTLWSQKLTTVAVGGCEIDKSNSWAQLSEVQDGCPCLRLPSIQSEYQCSGTWPDSVHKFQADTLPAKTITHTPCSTPPPSSSSSPSPASAPAPPSFVLAFTPTWL